MYCVTVLNNLYLLYKKTPMAATFFTFLCYIHLLNFLQFYMSIPAV